MISERAFVALGSNMGDRAAHLAHARARLGALPDTRLVAVSRIEETEPIGPVAQPPYLNQMVLLETTLRPEQLLAHCLAIEAERGRDRRKQERWGPRIVDIDILVFGDRVIREAGLEIPHPRILERAFDRLADYDGSIAFSAWLLALLMAELRASAPTPGAALAAGSTLAGPRA